MGQITIDINCGKTTCASKPGEFCQFFGTMRFGTVPLCRLFPSIGDTFTELHEKDGWVQRCDSCLEHVKG